MGGLLFCDNFCIIILNLVLLLLIQTVTFTFWLLFDELHFAPVTAYLLQNTVHKLIWLGQISGETLHKALQFIIHVSLMHIEGLLKIWTTFLQKCLHRLRGPCCVILNAEYIFRGRSCPFAILLIFGYSFVKRRLNFCWRLRKPQIVKMRFALQNPNFLNLVDQCLIESVQILVRLQKQLDCVLLGSHLVF